MSYEVPKGFHVVGGGPYIVGKSSIALDEGAFSGDGSYLTNIEPTHPGMTGHELVGLYLALAIGVLAHIRLDRLGRK